MKRTHIDVTTAYRDTPASDLELHRMQRARETGKVSNPKWYSMPRLPRFEFEAGKPPVFPAWVKQTDAGKPQALAIPHTDDPAEYVREFDRLNNLAAHPINWIRTTLGNFA